MILHPKKRECPCKGCTDRTLGCHGQCEKYKAWSDECDQLKATRNAQKDVEYGWANLGNHYFQSGRNRRCR